MNTICINTLNLYNFRNYESQTASFGPDINVICGDNAQGKTNLLEAVFYLGAGKSFRGAKEGELLRFGQTESRLEAAIASQGRAQSLEARVFHHTRRILFVNGVKLESPRELLGRLPCVFFGPEELGVVRAGAAMRRRFLDLALCQLRPRYVSLLAGYNRLHAHKARLLRDTAPGSSMAGVLPDFNRRLAETAAALTGYRAELARRIAETAAAFHREAADSRETLRVSYLSRPNYDPAQTPQERTEALWHLLCEKESAEWAAGRCLYGSHRDDLDITLDKVNARTYGSQGQTRTAALALKLAERQIFREELGAFPVLLMDDVLSELDPRRQDFILRRLGEGQVLITCCESKSMAAVKNGKTIVVEGGTLKTE